MIKDQLLHRVIFKELGELVKDVGLGVLALLTMMMIFQSSTLVRRLMKVIQKKKERDEIKSLKLFKSLKKKPKVEVTEP